MSKKSKNLLRIYNRLKRGPVNIEVIKQWAKSHDLNISERTLYRYLDELEDIVQHNEKLIITEGEKNKKTWKIEYDKSSAKLNEFDIQSYLLFKNLMPLPLVKSREETFDRIENLFYKNYSKSNFEDFSVFADRQISNSYFYELLSLDGYQKILNDAFPGDPALQGVDIARGIVEPGNGLRDEIASEHIVPQLLPKASYEAGMHLCALLTEVRE